MFDRLVSFEGSLLRMMMKVKRNNLKFGFEDFVTWRRRHTRVVRAYFFKFGLNALSSMFLVDCLITRVKCLEARVTAIF